MIEFGTRGGFTNDEGSVRIGNLFYGTKGWLWIEEAGKKWQSYFGPKNEKGPGADTSDRQRRADRASRRPSTRTTRTSSTRFAPTIRRC